MAEMFLREDLRGTELLQQGSPEALLHWAAGCAQGADPVDIYRDKEGRRTLRVHLGERSFFLKSHAGVGWLEICKNLMQLRLPVTGAAREYRAVRRLQSIDVDTLTVAAYASKGRNPATIASMILTDDLLHTVSLEDYCADWAGKPPPFSIRKRLLLKLADTARRMHGAGINHRDFYICHFHLDEASLEQDTLRCYLIDLHRAQLRRQVPFRWRVKDLAGLYFSAMDCGLSQRDLLRFMHHYTEGGLRVALDENAGLWRKVASLAKALYRKGHGRSPPVIEGVVGGGK